LRLGALLLATLAACGAPPLAGGAAALGNRDDARRGVLSAVLDALADPESRLLVVDDTLRPGRFKGSDVEVPASGAARAYFLPDGRWILRPDIEGVTPEIFEDWLAHIAPAPTPRDLVASRPIERLSADGYAALFPKKRGDVTPSAGEENEDLVSRPFRRRYPGASCYLHLSDVGFSPSSDRALVRAVTHHPRTFSGLWFFLRREGDRWVVVEKRRSWISCG
jgi:hypothetical protein